MSDYISREAAFKEFAEFVRGSNNSDFVDAPTWNDAVSLIGSLPAIDAVPVETVCEMLESLVYDPCPCNYNDIDEWLPYVCEKQDECPNPSDKYGCWKQFIKHFGRRREEEHYAAD